MWFLNCLQWIIVNLKSQFFHYPNVQKSNQPFKKWFIIIYTGLSHKVSNIKVWFSKLFMVKNSQLWNLPTLYQHENPASGLVNHSKLKWFLSTNPMRKADFSLSFCSIKKILPLGWSLSNHCSPQVEPDDQTIAMTRIGVGKVQFFT